MASVESTPMATTNERSTAIGRGSRQGHLAPLQLKVSIRGVSKYLNATAMLNGMRMSLRKYIAPATTANARITSEHVRMRSSRCCSTSFILSGRRSRCVALLESLEGWGLSDLTLSSSPFWPFWLSSTSASVTLFDADSSPLLENMEENMMMARRARAGCAEAQAHWIPSALM